MAHFLIHETGLENFFHFIVSLCICKLFLVNPKFNPNNVYSITG